MVKITDGRGLDVSRIAKQRRAFLLRHLGGADLRSLEIGALDNPTFTKSEGEIYFADFFTQKESQDRHKSANSTGHTVEKIVPVDFVLRGEKLSDVVSVEPDLIMAHHVIEHIPNPIEWFRDIRATCEAGASIFLSVPDRGYTFDYFKPLTDAVDWIRAFEEKADRPTKYQILRHLFYHAKVTAADVWSGVTPNDHLHRLTMRDAISKANILCETYTDVHCWVFTADSFKTIIDDLSGTDLLQWKVRVVEPVAVNENEFRVILTAI